MHTVLFVIAVLILLVMPAHGHGDGAWIGQGGYRNAAGELCCGERDCFELAAGDVRVTASRPSASG